MQKWVQLTRVWAGHAIGEQISVTAEDADSLVLSGFAKEVTVSADAELMSAATKGMAEKVASAIGDAVANAVKVANDSIKAPRIEAGQAEDDKKKSLTDLVRRVMRDDAPGLEKIYGSVKSSPLAESSGTTGGYLIPPEFLATLLKVEEEKAIVRPRARVIPIAGRSITMPMLDQTSLYGGGHSNLFGGVIAKWTAEANTRPETEPQFKQVELAVNELAGLSKISNVLLQDSAISIDSLLADTITGSLAWEEDSAFFFGDGVGKPKGISNAPATLTQARTTANLFKLADAANMLTKLMTDSGGTAVWVMSQTVLAQLVQLADGSGRVVYMPNPAVNSGGSVTQSVPMMLLGKPVIISDKLPALGTTGDVLLCDFSKYVIVERPSIEIAYSREFLFGTNQTALRFIRRVGGQPWLDAPITYADGTTQVSPFVRLSA